MSLPVQRRSYPQLDSLRAVASIAVVATHTCFWAGLYTHGLFGVASQRLEVGVALFFGLSGFLLSRPYLDSAKNGTPHDSYGQYLRKRSLRIVPVYWVCVVAAMVLIADNRDLGAGRWVQNLTLVDLFVARELPQGLTQMWSLSTEAVFYLLLPLFGILMARLAGKCPWHPGVVLLSVAVLYAINIVWVAVAHSTSAAWGGWAARWIPSYLGWFGLGIALAAICLDAEDSRSRVTKVIRSLALDRATCWLCALVLFILVSTPIAGSPLLESPTASEAVIRNILYGAIAFFLILPCVLGRDDTTAARLLSHPFPRHLGHISYSLFCCHVIVLYLVTPLFGFELFQSPPVLLFIVVLGISLVVSELLYRYVETPFLRLKDRKSAITVKQRAPKATPTKP